MAKTIRDEDIRLSIIINGNQAQKEIYELDAANRKLIDSNKEIQKDMQNLVKQGKKQSEEYNKLNHTLNQNSAILEKNKLKIRDLEDSLGITNLTLTQLRRRATEVRVAMSNMAPNSAQMKSYSTELSKINARIAELTGRAKVTSISLGDITDQLKGFQTLIAGVVATFTGVYISFQRFIAFQHKLSDAQADVMKATGLTKAEIDELTKSFNTFNTRTPRLELLKLAEEGGRLGIEGSNNLLKYVNVANQLKVALGDDLSEVQIREVGKLTEVYKVGAEMGRDFEQSIMSLGSAINEVAASGSNQASFQVDYMKRQAGIAAKAKIGAANNIGYAATFDEIGQSVEVSATAMNKVWMDMYHNSSTYAKIAGISIKDFNQLLDTDSNAAMKAFLRGLNGNNEGLSIMIHKLSDLDVGGVRGAQALSALAGNIDKLEQKQQIANQALIENISLTNEYNVKNNNVAASLDKINKKVQGWFTSESLTKFFEIALDGFAKLIGATEDTDGTITKWRENLLFLSKILLIVIAGVLSYKTAVQLAAIWTNRNTDGTLLYNIVLKTQNALTAISIVRTQLFAAAQMLLRGNVKGAITSIRELNIVLGISPWGAVIALVTACTAAYFAFRQENDKVINKQKILNDVRAEGEKSIFKEITQIQRLFEVAKNENLTKEQRIKAISQLNKISPQYLGNLKLETINTNEASKAIGAYILMLRKKAQEQAFNKKLEDIESRKIDAKNKKQSDYDDYANLWGLSPLVNSWLSSKESKLDLTALDELSGKELDKALSKYTKEARLIYKQRRKELDELASEGKLTEEAYREFLQSNPEILPESNDAPSPTPTNIHTSNSSNKSVKDKVKEQREKELKELQKYNEDLAKEIENNGRRIYSLTQDNEDSKVSLMKEGYKKEVAELQRTNEKKIQALEVQFHTEEKLQAFRDVMRKTESELSKAEIGKDKERTELLQSRLNLLNSVYEQMLVENKQIQDNIITSWEIYNSKLSIIIEKGVNERIEILNKEFEAERISTKNNFTSGLRLISTVDQAKEQLKDKLTKRELSKIKTLNQAREALRKEFDKDELKAQKKHLEELVAELNTMMNYSEWEGMDLTVLSEEQKEVQKGRIEELEAKISELHELLGKSGSDEPTGDGLLSSLGGSKDILGMTPEQWEKLFADTDFLEEKLAKVLAVAQMMQNTFAAYYDYVNANEQAQIQKFEEHVNHKKETLQKQLDEGYITQEQYDIKVEKLEKDLEKRKALSEYKAAKRKKQMDIASAISSTSLAILNALSTVKPFWAAIAMSAVAASMGALQLATIKSTPLPSVSGYEQGKYDTIAIKRAQDGKVFNAEYGGESRSGMVNKPTLFLAGEGGKKFPEMIIDGNTLTRMKPDVKDAMYHEVARINGFEKGYYPSSTNDRPSDSDTPTVTYYGISFQMLEEIRKQTKILETIKDQRQYAILDDSPYQMLKLKDAQDRAKEIVDNGKVV